MKMFDYLKWKRKYNKIKKALEEAQMHNKFLFQENQMLKTSLRKTTQEKNKLKNELKKYEKSIDK